MNAIYIVKIRKYDSTGMEHNYLKDEKTMSVHGVAGKPTPVDILNFSTSYYNPCQKDRWNVVCVVYDTTSSKSLLWVNHGKICCVPCTLKPSTLNLFNRVVHFDDAITNGHSIVSIKSYYRCYIL